MIKEVHDIAGQHEVIAESLQGTVYKDLQNLMTELKQDRKKVSVVLSSLPLTDQSYDKGLCFDAVAEKLLLRWNQHRISTFCNVSITKDYYMV